MLADTITKSRMLLAVFLLFLPLSSPLFGVFYLLSGISDMADGFLARKLHTASEAGARLDSMADLCFAVVYAVRLLPRFALPLWIWFWIAGIAVLKIAALCAAPERHGIPHTRSNKITGAMLFLLPLTLPLRIFVPCAAASCIAASCAAISDWRTARRLTYRADGQAPLRDECAEESCEANLPCGISEKTCRCRDDK